MKKIIVVALSVLAFTLAASAQPRAIGIRGGYGVEFSYQHSIDKNFIEGDLGWSPKAINLVAAYDFVFAQAGIVNFYVGPGAQLGIYSSEDSSGKKISALNLGILGQIGFECQIPSIPLNVSIDWRPVFNFVNGGFCPFYGALGLRYRF